jgi:hypothetical protein
VPVIDIDARCEPGTVSLGAGPREPYLGDTATEWSAPMGDPLPLPVAAR